MTNALHRTAAVLALAALALPMVAGCSNEGGDAESGAASSGGGRETPAAAAGTEEIAALAAGERQFAFDMYARLAGDGNLFFSPYSISVALGMTAGGARGNTEYEMASVLRFPTEDSSGAPMFVGRETVAASYAGLERKLAGEAATDGYELHVANRLWGEDDYPFLQSYLDFVSAHYGAGFERADFTGDPEAERLRINAWAQENTRDRIRDLVPPGGIDSLTTLVLTNAVYFKGMWQRRFDEERTEDAPFYGATEQSTVPLMSQKAEFPYHETEDVQVIELPYEGDEISMLVVLPREESPMDLTMLESTLSPETFDVWRAAVSEREVRVYLPRFSMTWGTADIARDLAALGMRDAFDGSRADFSGMTDLDDLFIGPVFHKAFVAVDEEGTEAAAATAVVMKRLAVQHETVFRADRPFMFAIVHNETGAILFMGRVLDL
jgi:serpin B